MQTKKVSQFTILASSFGMFYSFIGALLFILTLSAHSKLITHMGNVIDLSGNLGMIITSLAGEIYSNYTMIGIWIATIILIISQILEFRNKPYSKKSLIRSGLNLLIAIIVRYALGTSLAG